MTTDKHEMLDLGDRAVRRYIFPADPVVDGTVRCIACGQIDEPDFHNTSICLATRNGSIDWDREFSAPTAFVPIDEASKDGSPQLVKRGPDYAKAQWTGTFWSEPFGPNPYGTGHKPAPVQIDFEPTHYAPKDPRILP